jgi:hypothetical protein
VRPSYPKQQCKASRAGERRQQPRPRAPPCPIPLTSRVGAKRVEVRPDPSSSQGMKYLLDVIVLLEFVDQR